MSFQKAAEELSVTPAAVSYQVRQLEDQLGVQLFQRLNRSIALTSAGATLLPGLSEGFTRLSDAVSAVERLRHDPGLVISVGPAFTAKVLAPRLWAFLEAYPEHDVRISANLRRTNLEIDGIDAVIRFGDGNYPDYHVDHLIDDFLTPLCSPEYQERLKIDKPADLLRCSLIHDTSLEIFDDLSIFPHRRRPDWRRFLELNGLDTELAEHGARFNHADHGLDAAIEGAGIVLGRSTMAARDILAGRLVAPLKQILKLNLGFYFVCRKDAINRPAIAHFRDWLREEMRELSMAVSAICATAQENSPHPSDPLA